MENVNARRGFLKGFGLLSAFAAGAAAPYIANTNTVSAVRASDHTNIVPPVDISHLAPLGTTNLTLTADNEPPPPPPPQTSTNGYVLTGSTTSRYATVITLGPGNFVESDKNNVNMSVGKDNRLWIQVDGHWRRVALEG